jgi:ribonuclease BN (tRNA processing enzyme)
MRVTLLGSGSAFSPGSFNAASCVDGRLLVDCGAPVQVAAGRAGLDVETIRTLLITHFHADHTFNLPMFLGARALRREHDWNPLVIAGPVGTPEFVERLLRTGYGGRTWGLICERLQLTFVQLQDGSHQQLDGYRVTAHAMLHSTGPSLGYSITDAAGSSAGFTGDSGPCAALERLAAAVQLLVIECSGGDHEIAGGHLWRAPVEELARRHPATLLVNHMERRLPMRGVLVGHDGLSLDVPRPGTAPSQPPDSMAPA